jgi:hypothetical protein
VTQERYKQIHNNPCNIPYEDIPIGKPCNNFSRIIVNEMTRNGWNTKLREISIVATCKKKSPWIGRIINATCTINENDTIIKLCPTAKWTTLVHELCHAFDDDNADTIKLNVKEYLKHTKEIKAMKMELNTQLISNVQKHIQLCKQCKWFGSLKSHKQNCTQCNNNTNTTTDQVNTDQVNTDQVNTDQVNTDQVLDKILYREFMKLSFRGLIGNHTLNVDKLNKHENKNLYMYKTINEYIQQRCINPRT